MVRLTDRPDMTLDVYRGRKTTIQQQQQSIIITVLYTIDSYTMVCPLALAVISVVLAH